MPMLGICIKIAFKFCYRSKATFVTIASIAMAVASSLTILSVLNGFGEALVTHLSLEVPHIVISLNSQFEQNDRSIELGKVIGNLSDRFDFIRISAITATQSAISSRGGATTAIIANSETLFENRNLSPIPIMFDNEIVISKTVSQALGTYVGDIVFVLPTKLGTKFNQSPQLRVIKILDSQDQTCYTNKKTINLISNSFVNQIHILLKNPKIATQLKEELNDNMDLKRSGAFVRSWTDGRDGVLSAIKTEKYVAITILAMVLALATSSIASAVTIISLEKQRSVAILRSMGLSKIEAVLILSSSGALLGIIGILIGMGLGIVLAEHIDEIRVVIEKLIGAKILGKNYIIFKIPHITTKQDIILIGSISMTLLAVFCIVPSIRESKKDISAALTNE